MEKPRKYLQEIIDDSETMLRITPEKNVDYLLYEKRIAGAKECLEELKVKSVATHFSPNIFDPLNKSCAHNWRYWKTINVNEIYKCSLCGETTTSYAI